MVKDMKMGYVKDQREALKARIKEVLLDDPSLTNVQLRERFNCGIYLIDVVRRALRLPDPRTIYPSGEDLRKAKVQDCCAPTLGIYQGKNKRRKFN
jgi:hypothetical protein